MATIAFPSACKSNVPAGALLKVEPGLQLILPAVQTPTPPLITVPPVRFLLNPLTLRPPLTASTRAL